MRIAVVHNQPTGGARRALHAFGTEMARSHQLDVFTLTTAEDVWMADDYATSISRRPLTRRTPIRFGLYVNDFLYARDRRDLATAYAAIAHDIDASDYDVALVDVCRFSLVPSVLTELNTPSVYYAHNGPAALEGGSWDSAQTTWARLRTVWHEPFERRAADDLAAQQRHALLAATVVATNSQHTRERLRAGYGVDAVVCPPGVEIPVASIAARRRANVLSVGEIEPRKGFAFLVDAIARVPEADRPILRLVANGANPVARAALEARARAGPVELAIRIDPPHAELEAYYREAQVFVYAAHNEALGLAPLEAMAHGTPVVAVAEGGVPETVVDGVTGVLVPRDTAIFAARLDALLHDESRRARMGAAARAHVAAHWSVPARASALEALLASAAGTRVAGERAR